MKKLSFKDFMKKTMRLKENTMNESQLQKINISHMYPRDSKIYSDKRFVNINKGGMGGTHWFAFYVKINKSFYFESFGFQPDKFLLDQLPNSILYHNYIIQDINSKYLAHIAYTFSI